MSTQESRQDGVRFAEPARLCQICGVQTLSPLKARPQAHVFARVAQGLLEAARRVMGNGEAA